VTPPASGIAGKASRIAGPAASIAVIATTLRGLHNWR
jgi:hypothetical protein